MNTNYNILDWDSQFFGYKIACMKAWKLETKRLHEIIGDLYKNKISLVYCYSNPNDKISNKSLLNICGTLTDQKITFCKHVKTDNNFLWPDYIKPYRLNYASNKLKLLSLQSGLYSRFNVDPNFINNEYEKLYLEWIDKSVKKYISKEILVYYKDNDEKGFVTLDIDAELGTIGLFAVDELERGKSIGKNLMNAALHYFEGKNVVRVEVVTQKTNIIACEFYNSMNFKIKNVENIYHLWM